MSGDSRDGGTSCGTIPYLINECHSVEAARVMCEKRGRRHNAAELSTQPQPQISKQARRLHEQFIKASLPVKINTQLPTESPTAPPIWLRPPCDYYLVWCALRITHFRLLSFQVCRHPNRPRNCLQHLQVLEVRSKLQQASEFSILSLESSCRCRMLAGTQDNERAGAQPPASVGALQPAAQ